MSAVCFYILLNAWRHRQLWMRLCFQPKEKKSRDFLIVLKNTVDFYGSLNDTTA